MEDRFIEDIHKILDNNRKIQLASTGQYTLGMLIAKLKEIQSNNTEEPNMGITFSFGNLVPDGLDSYRGYYNELAIGYAYEDYQNQITVPMFIQELEAAVGQMFYGYKGGEYVMTENTPLWVSKYGDASGTYVADVKDLRYTVMLVTRNTEE